MSVAKNLEGETFWPGLAALTPADRRAVLPLLAHDPWACELAKDNALLFFLLVRAQRRYNLSARKVQLMTRMKRTALLALLGYERSPAKERFLRRCGFLRLDQPEFEALQFIGRQPLPNWAMHWPLPHLSLLTRVSDINLPYAAHSCARVIRERSVVGHANDMRYTVPEFRGALPDEVRRLFTEYSEIDRLIALLEDAAEQRRERMALAQCGTFASVCVLHDDLADRGQHHWSALVRRRVAGKAWPAAPFPGNEQMLPITCAQMLIDEGYAMHHCIPTYIDQILAGTGYAYRLLAPQRATVFLRRTQSGDWHVLDVRLVCNAVPSMLTDGYVESWLARAKEPLARERAAEKNACTPRSARNAEGDA